MASDGRGNTGGAGLGVFRLLLAGGDGEDFFEHALELTAFEANGRGFDGKGARAEGFRDFGACLSPHNAARLLTGVETLSLRMDRHVANALAVAKALLANGAVAWVNHPSLPSHPDHELSLRLLPRGAGSIVVFGVKGGRAAGARFIEALKLASHLANVGDAKTLVIHPASTTHRQMSAEELAKAGVGEDMVRLSVGLEAAPDIIADLEQALAASQRG